MQNEKEEPGESGLLTCLRDSGSQTVFGLVLKIGNEHFAVSATGMLLCRVRKLHVPDGEAVEQGAHFWSVVQREHELPAKATKALFKFLEIFCYEVVSVELWPPVRRIEIKERSGAIKPLEDFLIRQILNLHPF